MCMNTCNLPLWPTVNYNRRFRNGPGRHSLFPGSSETGDPAAVAGYADHEPAPSLPKSPHALPTSNCSSLRLICLLYVLPNVQIRQIWYDSMWSMQIEPFIHTWRRFCDRNSDQREMWMTHIPSLWKPSCQETPLIDDQTAMDISRKM